tara:strand:- start:1866 stop:3779 length:1914 start_codon:yes stop_codon:yes gene_type:complete
MKKMLFFKFIMLSSFVFAANVTFRVNSSTVQGIVDSTSGVDLRGTVTQWGPGTNMTSDGGDYWSLTIALDAGDYQYKYGAQILNQDGTTTDLWENDIPGANYQGDNRTLTVGADDMTIDLDYLGSGPDGSAPYTATESIDVFFRVNMSQHPDFDPTTQSVYIAGSVQGWDPGSSVLTREGTSDYWSAALPVEAGAHEWKFTLGAWGTDESNNRGPVTISQDTTIQWVYWNDQGPLPFTPTGTLTAFNLSTSVANAVAGNGFELGDTLLVKYGYGGTQTAAMEDTLTNSVGNIYSVVLSNMPFDAALGLYYQYYKVKNGVQYREIYFNFDYTGDDQTLAERRFTALTGATDGGSLTLEDNVSSNVDANRMPTFRNTAPIGSAMTVTYTVDVRPAYYQILSGDVLGDIQGDINISSADQISTLGISMNGPATGGWVTWGGTLAGTTANTMHDDGTTGGDLVAGDSIYTAQFTYEATATVGQEFKFGIGGGDNESGFGLNHIENIDLTNSSIASYWGSINPNKYNAWNFDSNTPVLAVDEIKNGLAPNRFALSDNYPNPFNPTTSFSFSLPQGADVSINIYNLLGEKVAIVYNSYAKPGTYKVTWDGKNMNGVSVPSGLYIYELDAGVYYRQMRKMTLIK